jgi:CubicO group peptidase (beta-lactamase class C family)
MIHHPSLSPRRLTRRAALAALGLTPLTATALAGGLQNAETEPPEPRNAPDHVRQHFRPGGEFEQFVAQRAAQDQFSGTILVAYRGRPVLVRAYGMANQQASVPNRPDTIFNLASVTKCFTGLAVVQLIQDGAIAPYATLGTYLDGFTPKVAAVTIHQMLTHTAGLTDYTQSGAFLGGLPQWNSVDAFMDGVMGIIRQQREPDFTPGSQFRYSNSGFFALGAIVQQVSGSSYYDYVRERIFRPAGMADSDFYTTPQVLADARIARPYWTQRSGGRIDFTGTSYNPFIGGPADGAFCSAADLLNFVNALQAGTLLKPAFVELLTGGKLAVSPWMLPSAPVRQPYLAYGYFDDIASDQRVFGHPGNGPGKATSLEVFPDPGWISVIVSNYDVTINPIIELARRSITDAM